MKIEKLSDNSVQIELSLPEMEKRSLSIGKLNVDAPAYKKLVKDMVSLAEIELGFSISQVKVDTYIPENKDQIRFVLENIQTDEKTQPFAPVTVGDVPGNGAGIMSAEAGNANQNPNPGADLTAEILKRLMAEGIARLKSAGRSDAPGNDTSIRELREKTGLKKGAAHTDEDAPGEQEDARERRSIGSVLELRRRAFYGEDYRENGGTAVIAFASYNDLYAFLSQNSFENYRSDLYEYRGVFYLTVSVGKSNVQRLIAFDSLAGEYRGVIIPAAFSVPVLDEYGQLIFCKDAVKKVRASLG